MDHLIRAHDLMPAGARSYTCTADPKTGCKFQTFLKYRMCYHMKAKHKEAYDGRVLLCTHCPDKTFTWPWQLKAHLSQSHGVEPEQTSQTEGQKPKPYQVWSLSSLKWVAKFYE